MSKTLHGWLRLAIGGLPLALLLLCLSAFSTRAATPPSPFSGGAVYIGDEIYGVAGPAPVNCVAPAYTSAQPRLDAQRATWATAAQNAIPNSALLGSLLAGPSGTPVNTPLVLVQPDGFSLTVTPIDLAPAQALHSGTNATGVPSFVNVQMNGSPNGCTMQDNAPRPSAATGGDFYFNQLSNLHGLNGVRFTFSTPVQAFGAFFGDLETSGRGTLAFMRLLDTNGTLIADVPISSTIGINGGVAAENAQCSLTTVPGADVASQGLLPGCGNAATRWIGFVSATPVAQALVVVGDNDSRPGGQGLTERLSFMGPAVVRALPPAEVTVDKRAPASVTAGTPFNYTLLVTNTSSTLAAGVVLTDVAPAGVTFNAVTSANCQLAGQTLICTIGTLAAGASTTILLQATATGSIPISNSAWITATNDTNPQNNTATASITPSAPPPLNYCAALPTLGNNSLIINEIMYAQQGTTGDEWIELYATAAIPGNTPFFITDNESGATFKLAFTSPTSGIPSGTYVVIHRLSGTNDLNATDGLIELFGAAPSAVQLNNTGDNISLYQGSDTTGTVLDYVAYGSGTAVNGPGTNWSTPNAPAGASGGQSIAAIKNGVDSTSGNEWALSGNSATLGPATPGAHNNGKTACNVAITKRGPATGIVGQPFNYTISVSNTTNVTMTGVVVTDTQPASLIFNSVTGAGCNLSGGQLICVIGTLKPRLASTITVNATASTANPITNTAATNAISDTVTTDNHATVSTAFLQLGAIGDFVYFDPNQNGVQNSGETTPINGVPITLTLPNGSFTTTVTVDGFYQFPNLPPGVYTVTVGSAPGYMRTSQASYTVTLGAGEVYTQADFGFAYKTITVALAKRSPPLVSLGQAFPYTLTITNTDAVAPALDVVVTDTQLGGITFVSVNDARCQLFAGQVTCNLGNLPPNGVESIVLTATATAGGAWLNTAFITATNESTLAERRASFTTTVLMPAIALQKQTNLADVAAPPGLPLSVNSVVTWTYLVTNTGTVTLTHGILQDDQEGVIASGVTLRPGETRRFTHTGVVKPGQYSNQAFFTGVNLLQLSQTVSISDTSYYVGLAPTATPTTTPTPTSTPTATNTSTDTPTMTPTDTSRPTSTPTATNTSTDTPTMTPTDTPLPTSTPTDTPTEASLPTATDTPLPTSTPTASDTPTMTPTDTPLPTSTPTAAPIYTPQADLRLMKTADKITASSGDIVTFRLTLTNQGPDAATGVEVSDRLPAGMSYQQDQPQQGTYDALTGIWKVGDVPANTSVTLLLIVRLQ